MRPVQQEAADLDDGPPDKEALDLGKRWVTFTKDELERDPPEKVFVWDGRIPLGDVGVFSAKGGAGKTALLIGLAIHRATGAPFLGRAVRRGTTVILTAEDSREDYLRKIAAWRTWLGPHLDLAAVAKHVHLIDVTGVPFRLVQSSYGEHVPTAHVDMLIEVVKTRAPDADLIIIETVSRVGSDESNPGLSALVCASETVAKRTGASVQLVAHHGQDAARRNVGDEHATRGGTAITANGRFTITLTGMNDEDVPKFLPGATLSPQQQAELSILRVPKINPAPRQEPIVLQIVPTHWGLVLREYDAGVSSDPEERKRSLRRTIGSGLLALTSRHAKIGDPLSVTRLRQGLYKQVPGLAKQNIDTAVTDAIEDGFIRKVEREGKGGGYALVPGLLVFNETPITE